MPNLRIETVTTTDQLHALRPDWSDLWERCPDATPFQSPEWLLPWWSHLGRGRLRTLALWDGERLVGLVPLFTQRYFGLPIRRLVFIGTGNSDYLDALVDPEVSSVAAPQLMTALEHDCSAWVFCDFQQLRPSSFLLQMAPAAFQDLTFEQEVCPILTLAGSAAGEVLPHRLGKNVRYYSRRIEREGGVFGLAQPQEVAEVMNALFELHAARWRRRKLPGVFTSGRVRSFHQDVARGFSRRGWLRLHHLTLAREVRAALYCFSCRGRTYYYAGGFDPALAAWSPGTVLTGMAIQGAASEHAVEFDFLRGDEPYKYRWGAINRANYRRLLWRRGSLGAAARGLVRLECRVEHGAKQFARWLQQRGA